MSQDSITVTTGLFGHDALCGLSGVGNDIGAYARDLGPISLQLGPRVEAVRLITQSTSDFS